MLLVVAALVGSDAAVAGSEIARGEYLIHAGGCIDCHTEDEKDALPLAGGRKLETLFGVFYSPNITPDAGTGIGNWSDADFLNAFWEGVNPDGDYTGSSMSVVVDNNTSKLTKDDRLAIAAYLKSLPALDAPD